MLLSRLFGYLHNIKIFRNNIWSYEYTERTDATKSHRSTLHKLHRGLDADTAAHDNVLVTTLTSAGRTQLE